MTKKEGPTVREMASSNRAGRSQIESDHRFTVKANLPQDDGVEFGFGEAFFVGPAANRFDGALVLFQVGNAIDHIRIMILDQLPRFRIVRQTNQIDAGLDAGSFLRHWQRRTKAEKR